MKKSMRGKIRGMAAGTIVVAVSLVASWAGIASAKKKEKAHLPGCEKRHGEGCESDNQWRAGRYTSWNDRDNRQSDTDRDATRASSGSDAAGNPARASACWDGSWEHKTTPSWCFKVEALQYRLDNAPVWRYIAKNGLKSPRVEAVEEFREAVEESEKAAAQKQQQQGQKKSP